MVAHSGRLPFRLLAPVLLQNLQILSVAGVILRFTAQTGAYSSAEDVVVVARFPVKGF